VLLPLVSFSLVLASAGRPPESTPEGGHLGSPTVDLVVEIAELSLADLGLSAESGGVVARPSGGGGIPLRVSPATPGATARLLPGEDGIPQITLALPLPPAANGAQRIAADLRSFEPGPVVPLPAVLLRPRVEPAGDGAPPMRAAIPASRAFGPAVIAVQLARAGDVAWAQVLIRAGGYDGEALHLAAALRLELTVTRGPAVSAPPRPTLDGGPVEVVIVTVESLRPEFERLEHFRSRLGLRAEVCTREWIDRIYSAVPAADPAARIRAFLADARAQWGTRWVLLGGDTDVIPARYAVSSYFVPDFELIPSDLYYAALEGDWNADGDDRLGEAPGQNEPGDEVDLIPDLLVGRAPVSTPDEARRFVERQIAYELGSGAGPDYPASVVFLAEQLFDSLDGAEIAEEARALLPPTVNVARLYEHAGAYPGSIPETKSAVIAALEQGSGIVDHVGHGFRNTLSVGEGTLGNAEADALDNKPRLPIFVALNCSSAAIDFNSIGERLVKNPEGGAIAYVGSSRYAFPSTARHYQNAFFHAAFAETIGTVGEAIARARSLLAPAGIVEGAHRWTQFALTLIGDPLTPLFARPPAHLVLRYPASVSRHRASIPGDSASIPGDGNLMVGVTAAGEPVTGARVTLLASEGLASGITDALGEAAVPIPPGAPGLISVAATASHTWPALGAIQVGSSTESLLHLGEVRVEDTTGGDGDGVAEAGETAELRVTVMNLGDAASGPGAMSLALLSGPAAVIDAETPIPVLEPSATAEVGALRLRLDDGAGDGTVLTIEFTLATRDSPLGTRTLHRTVRRAVPAAAPRLRLAGRAIDGDGRVEPGESVRYTLELANDGGGTARAVTAAAQVIDAATGEPAAWATLLDGRARFGDLRPGERTAGDPFVFVLAPEADPAGLRLEVTIAFALGSLPPRRLDFQGPAAPAGLRSRGSESAVVVSWDAVSDSDLLGYEIERAPSPAGPFAPLTPRPLAAAFLADSGLPGLTAFAYRVTAVDSSQNRSPVSAVVVGTTNPGLHPGWPVAMGQETTSSPILADLDRDGAAEIVTGADALYVWRGDASELRDGDGDLLTRGVFTRDGADPLRGFHAVPVVADLDGDQEPEIIAVAWQQAQIFAWNRDGSRVSGWPRSLGGPPNWGSPAAGDLDQDGDLEVTVVGGDTGAVFAWHHDGRELRDGDGDPATDGVLLATGASFSTATPALGDLDGGGDLELVVGLDEPLGLVHALKPGGGEARGWPVALGGAISASAALGDLDGDGRLEVVIAVEDDSVHVLSAGGAPRAGWPQWAFLDHAPARTSSPVLADLDRDGRAEVILAENSAPPPTQHVARLRVWRAGGAVLPGFENVTFATEPEATAARATQSTPVVGDVDGDGWLEILLGAEDGRLYAWNHDGTPVAGFPIQTGGELRGSAALGDVDGDGLVEVVMAGWDRNLYVWKLTGEVQEDLFPWPFFRRDAQNRGNLALAPLTQPASGPSHHVGVAAAAAEGSPNFRSPWPIPAYPGSAFGFVLRHGGSTRLTLFAVNGRVVRRLMDGPLGPGDHQLHWDGRIDRGCLAPAGVYWLRLEAPGGTAVRRVVILR